MLSGPVVSEQKVLVFAGEAELEVSEGSASGVKGPDAHEEQYDVGGNQTGNVAGVLEGLKKKRRNRNECQLILNLSL